MRRRTIIALTLVLAGAAAGCGSTDKPAPKKVSAGTSGPTSAPVSSYNPKIDPAQFTTKVTNRYLPFRKGAHWVYTGTKDGAPQHVDVRVTNETKTILGVPCVVVRDVVTVNSTLAEKTVDWYSQDDKGNLWYFGEVTKEYKNGVVSSTHGTWEAGVDNAKPGIVMQANPKPGGFYRQEYRPGIAEDQAKILTIHATQKVPMGTFRDVVVTKDIDPLNPDKIEHKWYAKDHGTVHVIRIGSQHHEEIKLVSHTG